MFVLASAFNHRWLGGPQRHGYARPSTDQDLSDWRVDKVTRSRRRHVLLSRMFNGAFRLTRTSAGAVDEGVDVDLPLDPID